jgi:arabinogalactan endo-1,4-beta-galactosidase
MMKDSIFLYTKTVMTQLKNQNTLPDLVQIGNEIANGMLWDMGRVSGWFESEEQWAKFGGLIKAAIRGLKESLSPKDSVKILIHFDNGASKAKCQHFFDHIILQGIDFDIFCVSYYSYWHGSINELRENLAFLASKYKRDIFVVETAYPWATHPQYPLDSTKFTYPATPIGQHSFLKAVKTVVKNIPDNRGKGFFYWAPEWIEVTGWGSPALERLALFDYEGNALPGMEVFKEE